MGKRELVAVLCLSSWCLLIVVWPRVYLQFEIVVFPDHTHYFDAIYRRVKKKIMELPSEILAFELRKARINHKEKLLVLTVINYGNRKNMNEEAKTLL